jgi:hypothetical protein
MAVFFIGMLFFPVQLTDYSVSLFVITDLSATQIAPTLSMPAFTVHLAPMSARNGRVMGENLISGDEK